MGHISGGMEIHAHMGILQLSGALVLDVLHLVLLFIMGKDLHRVLPTINHPAFCVQLEFFDLPLLDGVYV